MGVLIDYFADPVWVFILFSSWCYLSMDLKSLIKGNIIEPHQKLGLFTKQVVDFKQSPPTS